MKKRGKETFEGSKTKFRKMQEKAVAGSASFEVKLAINLNTVLGMKPK